MKIKKVCSFVVLLLINHAQTYTMEIQLSGQKHTTTDIVAILPKFNHLDSFKVIPFNLTSGHRYTISRWRAAHKEFRKQWHILRQTPEYTAYYKAPKKDRWLLKIQKDKTKEGVQYLEAKKAALQHLEQLPSIKIDETRFKIVGPASGTHCIAFDPAFIKYNDFDWNV
jgi:hypothetical protein